MKRSNNNDIDRLFQSHFDMHEVPVRDKSALWYRIQPKPRRRFLPFFIFLSVVSIGALSFVVLQNNVSNTEDENQVVSLLGVESEYKSSPLYNNSDALKEVTVHRNKGEALTVSESIDNEIILNETGINTKIQHSTTEPIHKAPDSKLNSKEQIGDINKIGTSEQSIAMVKTLNAMSDNSHENSEFKPVAGLSTTLMKHQKDESISPIQKNEISYFTVNKFTKDGIFDLFKKDKNPLDDCIAGGGIGHFYMDVYSILGIPLEEVKLNPGAEDQITYLSNWNEKYNTFPAFSLGAMIGYEFTSGLDIAIGAEYQKMESQYETTQTIIESVTVYDPMAYFFYDDNNEVVWVGDSVTATSTYDRTIAVGNSHGLIHIPLQLSYPLFRKGGWNIKASAAAALNLSFQYRGEFLRSDNSLVSVDAANQDSYFSPNLGVSLELGTHIGYRISPKWEAYLSPRIRYNQDSYLSDTQVISVTRNFVNLRMGVQYHF